MSKNKVFVKCGICEYQFDRKLVGKLQEGQEFVCVACSLGKRLTVLEERVNKLESCLKQDITDLKKDVAEIKAILVEFKGESKPKPSSKLSRSQAGDSDEGSQLLLVDLPPVTETANMQGKTSVVGAVSNRESILLVGNSMVRGVSNSSGKAKVVYIPGGGIADMEDVISGDLPANVILHVGANDVSKFKGRSEKLVDKIKAVLEKLKEKRKNVIISGIIPRPCMGRDWHNAALSLDIRMQTMCKKLGFGFIDNWSCFYGRKGNHRSDGLHLNCVGISMLESNFFDALKQSKK